MKFDFLIIFILVIIVILMIPKISFADQMSPAPSPVSSIVCQQTSIPITSICPSDYPRTGDMTPDGMKFCCK